MNTKRAAISLAVGSVAAALVTGSTLAQDKPTFVLGSVISTTGPAAALGIPESNAINLLKDGLAAQDLPFEISFITYDDKSDPTEAVNLVRKLIEEDQAHLVICCTTTPASMAILETVTESGVPAISMASGSSIVEPVEERHWVFKTVPSERLMFQKIFPHMRANGIKSVAFAGNQDSYGESGWVEFQRMATAEGLEIVADEWFARADTNMTPQALRIRNANPDAVYFHSIPPSANLAHQALLKVGYSGKIYHGAGAANNAFLGIAPEATEGSYVGVGAVMVADKLSDDNEIKPLLADFISLYEAEFGENKADMFAVSGWDAGRVVIEAISNAHDGGAVAAEHAAARSAIRASVERLSGFMTTSGVFNFSAQDHLGLDSSALVVSRIVDGKFTLAD